MMVGVGEGWVRSKKRRFGLKEINGIERYKRIKIQDLVDGNRYVCACGVRRNKK